MPPHELEQSDQNEVWAALATIPGFAASRSHDVSIKRMAGLTNRNYKVETSDGSYVLRLPGRGTSDYIDRRASYIDAVSLDDAKKIAAKLFGQKPTVITVGKSVE